MRLKVYTAHFYGHYIGGHAVIRAYSEAHARELLAPVLKDSGLADVNLTEDKVTIKLVPAKPWVDLQFDGDY